MHTRLSVILVLAVAGSRVTSAQAPMTYVAAIVATARAGSDTTVSRITGTVVTSTRELLVLELDNGRRREIDQVSIRELFVSTGSTRGRHAAIGAVFGGVAGSLIGLAAGQRSVELRDDFCREGWTCSYSGPGTAGALILGTVGGALVGGFIGAALPAHRWVPVSITSVTPRGLALSVGL